MVVNSFFADFELFLQFLRPNFVGSRFLSASAQTAPKIKRIAAFLPSNSAKKSHRFIAFARRACRPMRARITAWLSSPKHITKIRAHNQVFLFALSFKKTASGGFFGG